MKHVASPKKIGQRIKQLRIDSGKSVIEILAELQMSRQNFWFLETGRISLTLDRLEAISKCFGVKPEEIIGNGNGKGEK